MKDIKSYVIGFLTCACMFLIMGMTFSHQGNERYQIFSDHLELTLRDTKTGELYEVKEDIDEWVKKIKPISD